MWNVVAALILLAKLEVLERSRNWSTGSLGTSQCERCDPCRESGCRVHRRAGRSAEHRTAPSADRQGAQHCAASARSRADSAPWPRPGPPTAHPWVRKEGMPSVLPSAPPAGRSSHLRCLALSLGPFSEAMSALSQRSRAAAFSPVAWGCAQAGDLLARLEKCQAGGGTASPERSAVSLPLVAALPAPGAHPFPATRTPSPPRVPRRIPAASRRNFREESMGYHNAVRWKGLGQY